MSSRKTKSQQVRYCYACGYDAHLTEHHIHPRSYRDVYEGDINDPSNLVTLCLGCHRAVHYTGQLGKLKRKLKELIDKPIDKKRMTEQSLRDTYTAKDEAKRLLLTLDQPRARRIIREYQKVILEAKARWQAHRNLSDDKDSA